MWTSSHLPTTVASLVSSYIPVTKYLLLWPLNNPRKVLLFWMYPFPWTSAGCVSAKACGCRIDVTSRRLGRALEEFDAAGLGSPWKKKVNFSCAKGQGQTKQYEVDESCEISWNTRYIHMCLYWGIFIGISLQNFRAFWIITGWLNIRLKWDGMSLGYVSWHHFSK